MKKYSVARVDGTDGFGIFDVRGNQVGTREFEHEWEANLAGCHWACAGPLFTRLGFKPAETGSNYRAWEARPFYGVHAVVTKHPQTDWAVIVVVDSNPLDTRAETFKTRTAAAKFVDQFGDGNVVLADSMTGIAFIQDRRTAGRAGICRSCESYYTM